MAAEPKRPVRVAGSSGGFSDRLRAMTDLAKNEEVDVIVGDWLSELTMTIHGTGKIRNAEKNAGKSLSWEQQVQDAMFAENFLDCFEPALEHIAAKGIKIAVNAGASDTEILAKLTQQMCVDKGYPNIKVAWVSGDDATEAMKKAMEGGEEFRSLMHNKSVSEWGLKPVCAQAYQGGMGIARALTEGADVVICGRVSDASPIIGAAAWWHQWRADQFDELAGSLVIGHLLECASYVSGGYCADFKQLLKDNRHIDMGFPICAIDHKGEGIMQIEKNKGGWMTVNSVTSQLLYEIQGPQYYNCDVTAQLEGVKMEQVGENQVHVYGVKGTPPPPTTKIGITGFAGWQAEYHIYLCGLDIEEKCKMIEDQIRVEFGDELISKFSMLKFSQNGSCPIDPRNQDVATVDCRVFAQSTDRELLSMRNKNGFFRRSMTNFLQSCPGASLGNDFRQAEGKPYYEYHPSLLPQSALKQQVHLLWDHPTPTIDIPLAPEFRTYDRQQPSYETKDPVDLNTFGETVRLPLGRIVLGRSGDKCSDCNVGFFVRHDDEWEWLRSLLTVSKIKAMLGPEEYKGGAIDRFEIPGLRAVHFLLHDHLDRGYDACSTYDTLGKNCLEYLRAKTVDVPKKFADRGFV